MKIFALLALTLAASLPAATTMSTTPTDDDPFLWLEEIDGDRALAWVRAQNERSLGELTRDPRYHRYYGAALAIAEDKSRIPLGTLRNGWVYNLWQDEVNVRGLWRRARLDSYRDPSPHWESLLDVDALAERENANWVFKGAICLPPQGRRCLIELSDGGKDASVLREFDVESRSFVDGGFVLPEAKSGVEWQDADTLIVATDWGPGSLTTSGYPFIVKEWKRGQPLSSAQEIHRGQVQDVGVYPLSFDGDGGERFLGIAEADTFFTASYFTIPARGAPARITLPAKATLQALHHGELIFTIEEDWTIGGRTWRSGALLSMPSAISRAPRPPCARSWSLARATRSSRSLRHARVCWWPVTRMSGDACSVSSSRAVGGRANASRCQTAVP